VGDFRGALQIGEQGVPVAGILNDPASTLNVEWMLGVAHHLIGNQGKAVELCESAITHNPGSQRLNILRLGYDDRIVALVALARGLWLSGRPDRAVEVASYTVSEAERLEQPLTLGISLIWTTYVFLWIGDWAAAERMIDRLIEHAAKHFLGPYHAVGIGQKGELLIRRGDVVRGIEHIRRGQAALYETRHRIMTTVFATTLAEALASLRHFDEALQTIEQAIALGMGVTRRNHAWAALPDERSPCRSESIGRSPSGPLHGRPGQPRPDRRADSAPGFKFGGGSIGYSSGRGLAHPNNF